MKLGILINGISTLNKVYSIPLNGKKALQFRRLVKLANDEMALFEEARKSYVEQKGQVVEGSEEYRIAQGSKEHENFIKFLEELAQEETKFDCIHPIFTEDDLESTILSVNDLDTLIELKLLQD